MKSRASLLIVLAGLAIPALMAGQNQGVQQQHKEEHHRYKLADLGTFGGPVNYLASDSNGAGSVSGVLNDRGTIAGAADTSTPDPNYGHGSGFFPLDPLIMHAFQWHKGALTDLGALPGGNNSFATWISANGLIAGFSENGVIDPQFGLPQVNAVLWNDGEIVNLGGYFSQAFAVNNHGQVVGSTVDTATLPAAIFKAFLWQNGEMQDLGTLGGPGSFAYLVNERGQVAGMSFPNSTASSNCPFPFITHPFLWDDGKMVDLGTLGGTCGLAMALNNRGQVVGQSNLAGDQTAHPFLWDKGGLSDLGTLGGTFGNALWINDAGQIVGGAANQNDQAILGFLWKNGVMNDLGTPDGDTCSVAAYVNSKGQVVGTSSKTCAFFPAADRHAFLWENGEMIDLNTFLPPTSSLLQLTDGYNINDRGEIFGLALARARPGCGDEFACGNVFVLIPCDDEVASSASSCRNATQVTEESTPTRPAGLSATQTSLTPTQIRDRVQALLIGQRRRFPLLPEK
jgi:probable HAF family extracellular repeat protein